MGTVTTYTDKSRPATRGEVARLLERRAANQSAWPAGTPSNRWDLDQLEAFIAASEAEVIAQPRSAAIDFSRINDAQLEELSACQDADAVSAVLARVERGYRR